MMIGPTPAGNLDDADQTSRSGRERCEAPSDGPMRPPDSRMTPPDCPSGAPSHLLIHPGGPVLAGGAFEAGGPFLAGGPFEAGGPFLAGGAFLARGPFEAGGRSRLEAV